MQFSDTSTSVLSQVLGGGLEALHGGCRGLGFILAGFGFDLDPFSGSALGCC